MSFGRKEVFFSILFTVGTVFWSASCAPETTKTSTKPAVTSGQSTSLLATPTRMATPRPTIESGPSPKRPSAEAFAEVGNLFHDPIYQKWRNSLPKDIDVTVYYVEGGYSAPVISEAGADVKQLPDSNSKSPVGLNKLAEGQEPSFNIMITVAGKGDNNIFERSIVIEDKTLGKYFAVVQKRDQVFIDIFTNPPSSDKIETFFWLPQ